MPAALTTLESFRSYHGIPDEQTSMNERLTALIAAASSWIYRYTGATDLTTGTGNDETPLPEVELAANAMVSFWYRNQSTTQGRDIGGDGDRFGAFAMPTATIQLLAPFRIVGFGNDPEA
jgi:hypothetical protein